MSAQSENILCHELEQGCPPCSVKGRAKSPCAFFVSTKDKAIRFQRKDELLKLFPGFYIRKRNKARRVLPFALDHPPVTVGSNIRSPLQQNLSRRHLPFGIGVSRHFNTWKLFSQFIWGQHQPRAPFQML